MRKFLLLLFLIATPVFAQNVIAIRAGGVVDPARGSVAKNQVILVENGKIKAIGADVAIPAGAQTIDLSNEWVTPGLMDAHVHLTLTEVTGGNAPFESFYLKESSAFRGLRGLRNAQDLLRAGFTTVREVGNDANYATEDVKRAIQAGMFDGPTILSAGKIIAPFGGQSTAIPAEQGPFWRYEYIDADTPEEVRKAVRQNIYYGVDVIKLVADNSPFHFSLEEIKAAVDEAHHAGRAVAVHVFGGEAAQNVIDGGVDSVEHGFFLTDQQLQQMKQKGIFLVGTDTPRAQLDVEGTSGGIFPPPEELAPKIIDRLRRAYRIGVKMAFGTDTVIEIPNKTRADLMLDYLPVWKAAGVPNQDILKCMTINPAELLRINQQRGSLTPGLAADIIAMPANPLDDIESLRRVNFVMKDGKVIRRP
ncbi:MAG TPA: amidohydrolase family protein [Candidatus Angelobacter sp.]|jgi:imidazolonepropionase-like amidohydrolase|nr:amidohydrolase family protein [Candidatus Angelobacter sp.]